MGKRGKVAAAVVVDAGPPERAQHDAIKPRDVFNQQGMRVGEGRRVAMSIDAIEGITAEMRAAAVIWRDLYDEAICGVRVDPEDATLGELRIRSNVPPTTLPDRRLDAMAEYAAVMRLLGPVMGPVVERIVGRDMKVRAAAVSLGRNRAQLVGQLKAALDLLARSMAENEKA